MPFGPLQDFQRRSAVAFAEAIIPGSRKILAGDEATVARVEEIIGDLHPTLASGFRAAQSLLSAAAIRETGRPFYLLSADRQDEILQRWEVDPILGKPLSLFELVYKFVHFDRKPVYEGMGGRFNTVNALEAPRWLGQVHRADAWDGDEIECEAVVIGTGAGGAVVGQALAERGFAVVFVEEGEHYRRDAFDGSFVGAHQRFYRGAMSVGNAMVPIFVGRLVGGGTAINTGTSFRTPPWVLEQWCEDMKTDAFTPEAMTPYFDRVEKAISVTTADRKFIGPMADVIGRGCDSLGWHHFAVQRNAPECDGSGFCDFGCRTDARRGTNLSYVPAALEKGAVLLTGLKADKLIREGDRAVGIEGVTKTGRRLRVRSSFVVLAGGTIPTPLFLLSQGLGSESGEVGKNLSLHPSGGLFADFEDEIRPNVHMPQGYGCDEFVRDGLMILAALPDFNISSIAFPFGGRRLMDALDRYDHIGGYGLLLRDAQANGRVWREVGGMPVITYNLGREDVDGMQRAMVRSAEMSLRRRRAAGVSVDRRGRGAGESPGPRRVPQALVLSGRSSVDELPSARDVPDGSRSGDERGGLRSSSLRRAGVVHRGWKHGAGTVGREPSDHHHGHGRSRRGADRRTRRGATAGVERVGASRVRHEPYSTDAAWA